MDGYTKKWNFTKIILILNLVFIFGPWLIFVPGINLIFPAGFVQVGWMFTIMGAFTMIPVTALSLILHFFPKIKGKDLTISRFDLFLNIIASATSLFLVYWFLFIF